MKLSPIFFFLDKKVGDLNLWNLDNTKEHFYSGKTRQLHSSHLKVYDKLWSCLPYLQPMATFVYDSLSDYGIDKDGGSLHDVIGNSFIHTSSS